MAPVSPAAEQQRGGRVDREVAETVEHVVARVVRPLHGLVVGVHEVCGTPAV